MDQASSPACTELESLVMDWLGQAIGLPQEFLHKTPVNMATCPQHWCMVIMMMMIMMMMVCCREVSAGA